MNICRQCFREKSTDIGFTKVRFNSSLDIPIRSHSNITQPPSSDMKIQSTIDKSATTTTITTHAPCKSTTLTTSSSTYSTAKRPKKLTPSSRTVRIHEIHPRTWLDYGSVQWSNVSDELKNGVFDVFVNGGIGIGHACPVSRGCESPDLGSEGRIWGCCMECLEKRGFMLFPSSWFFLNNFNDGIFFSGNHFCSGLPYNLLMVWMSVACFRLALLPGFGVAFDVWLGEPIEVHR